MTRLYGTRGNIIKRIEYNIRWTSRVNIKLNSGN